MDTCPQSTPEVKRGNEDEAQTTPEVRESGHLSTKYPRGQIGRQNELQETDKVTEEIRNRYEIDYERDTKEI